jgi:transposase
LHNWHEKGRVNAIGALIGFSFLTVMLLNTSINSDIFYAWITQELLPRIPQYSVVVMDNAPFHKRKDIQEAFHKKNVILEYLPPYSPDLNPIEKKWAQAKAIRKQQRCDPFCLFTEHIHYDNL